MTFTCSDCGCIVDRGVVVASCGVPECCCRELPQRQRPASTSPP